jgi:hypothetical protein
MGYTGEISAVMVVASLLAAAGTSRLNGFALDESERSLSLFCSPRMFSTFSQFANAVISALIGLSNPFASPLPAVIAVGLEPQTGAVLPQQFSGRGHRFVGCISLTGCLAT